MTNKPLELGKRNTAERHLSGLIGTARLPDM